MAEYNNGYAVNVRFGTKKRAADMYAVVQAWSDETGLGKSAIMRQSLLKDPEFKRRLKELRKNGKSASNA